MKSANFFITLTFLLAFAIQAPAQKSNKKTKLTKEDKSKILQQVFDDGFEKLIDDENFAPCLTPIVNEEKVIFIETTEPSIFPEAIGEYRFKFLNEKEIELEIKSNNGDCYFKLNDFQVTNSKTIKVTLWRWIEIITVVEGKSWYPSRWIYAKGFAYEAKKNGSNWNIKFLGNTQIVS
jgi:hypothetical protein